MPVYITEYRALARDGFEFHVAAGAEPNLAEQAITVSGTSAQSSAFNGSTAFVMVHTSEVVCLKFGVNPTAVTTAHRLGSGETRFYGVVPGQKLAAIVGT